MNVAVCIATYNRPKGLSALLSALNGQVFADRRPDVRLIVVDNDSSGSARAVCDEIRRTGGWPLTYCIEPTRGIPYVRNRAVACAGSDVHFLAFIDDDEVPEPNWLDELLRVQHRYDADVVTGPVVRRFMTEVPAWIATSRFFDLPRRPTGSDMTVAMTNNTLARTQALHAIDGPFDVRLGLTGADDAHCFRRVHLAGFRIVWADDAIVYESVPATRATLLWILRHAYRVGNAWGLIETDLNPSWKTRARVLAWSAARVARGVILLPLGLAVGPRGFARAFYNIYYAGGLVASLAGIHSEGYRTTDGA
ncbi:MAG: glycosyltransferase family 2 protein [Phycisphaerales bacterium]|nr:MAG: glycosyltransferase family 2 protein [Phycisphaerales bacterium]